MKLLRALLTSTALIVAAAPTQGEGTPDHAPYAGMESRAVKALSDQQIADLEAGRGMGLALAAELNGYPGPRHVLDLAGQLRLTDRQRAKAQGLFDAMKAETIPIGERIIVGETMLDRLFVDHRIAPATLDELTARIGTAQGELRAAHLRYHLSMMEVLSPEQVAHYRMLRGYGHHMEGVH